MNYCRECIVIDFDGTLTESPVWCDYSRVAIDTELITDCQGHGYAVAVSTCSVVSQVAAALSNRGVPAWADTAMKCGDKAMPWWYGRWAIDIWNELERRRQLDR